MINTFVNISGKLPAGLVELYQTICRVADGLGIPLLVVGAMARDLILVHGYGARIERGTRDVDFAINLPSWDDFYRLKGELIQAGLKEDLQIAHRLVSDDHTGLPWEVDIIPFGEVAENNQIHWPPNNDIVMSVLGFQQVEQHAIRAQISEQPQIILTVASPAGIVLLKLIAWLERDPAKQKKDAADINYIFDAYRKIPEIYNALFEEGDMESAAYDESLATAIKLGRDVAAIATKKSSAHLYNELFDRPDRLKQLAMQMPGYGYSKPNDLLTMFIKSFRHNSNT